MKTAIFCGIDGENRPIFKLKNSNGKHEYYCTVDYLCSHHEKPDMLKINKEGLHYKGNNFEGEPHYKINDVLPAILLSNNNEVQS